MTSFVVDKFRAVQVQVGDGYRGGFETDCGNCGKSERIPVNRVKGPGGSDDTSQLITLITRKFRDRGWDMQARAKDCRCPDCVPKREAKVEVEKVVVEKVVDPKDMPKPAYREIFNELCEVYGDENIGYRGTASDDTVALKLKRPVAWIAHVRDTAFGPERGSEVVTLKLSEAIGMLEECRAMVDEARELKREASVLMSKQGTLDKKVTEFVPRVNMLETQIMNLQKAVRPQR